MNMDTMTYAELPCLENRHVLIFGIDENTSALVSYICEHHPSICIDAILAETPPYAQRINRFMGYEVLSLKQARQADATHPQGRLSGAVVLVARNNILQGANLLLDDDVAEIYCVSRSLHAIFHPSSSLPTTQQATRTTEAFYLRRASPKIPIILNNAFSVGADNVIELADFERQEFTLWRMPAPSCELSLREFSNAVPQNTLPMRMSHLNYLLWKRALHVAQLSPSRRYVVGTRYNYFFLDILDTATGTITHWHDLPPEQGLWDYVATGDFDGDKDEFLFVRWPVTDTIKGMQDGSNRVHCQVGRLHLDSLKADILAEFDFQDRIHQCTISGDGRYMVFAPMRVLRPGGDPKKLKPEDIMRNLQQTVVLDDMLTLDLETKKTWRTQIPYPIPAHFELDPFDPHVFYVSTHSLMPHADGVLCFQPGTLHKMRILDEKTILEGTYTHPAFVRTTQHCVFAWKGKAYMAATNQNKLEIIDTDSMTLWHCHKIADDPFYDNANFSDPEFLKKPFSLPPQPAWCDSVSASADGEYLVLYLANEFALFSMQKRDIVGAVRYRDNRGGRSTHGRYWMQNAPAALIEHQYKQR
ncbi:MAG: hypothetical protein IJU37_06795, partial [Desulfovibrio sp.]|nr:hypothetical protein [Desulfovibrio sp.]